MRRHLARLGLKLFWRLRSSRCHWRPTRNLRGCQTTSHHRAVVAFGVTAFDACVCQWCRRTLSRVLLGRLPVFGAGMGSSTVCTTSCCQHSPRAYRHGAGPEGTWPPTTGALDEDYIVFARARGALARNRDSNALRNALIPIVTEPGAVLGRLNCRALCLFSSTFTPPRASARCWWSPSRRRTSPWWSDSRRVGRRDSRREPAHGHCVRARRSANPLRRRRSVSEILRDRSRTFRREPHGADERRTVARITARVRVPPRRRPTRRLRAVHHAIDPKAQNLNAALSGPTRDFWFGTDSLGPRHLLAHARRLAHGVGSARSSSPSAQC